MRNLLGFFGRMNILLWTFTLFVAHSFMYLLLGTDTWLITAGVAAVIWGAALLFLKRVAKRTEDKGEIG